MSELPELVVGAHASSVHVIEAAAVEAFAGLTGDANPIHLEEAYARETSFGRRIAHGMLAGGYISAILGTTLPGPGSIYLSQTLSFHAPMYLGDTITTTVTIEKIREDKPVVTARTEAVNQDGRVVISGEAVLLCPRPSEIQPRD